MNRNPKIPICVFTKPPRPGELKTRLIPMIGAEAAAILARAFFDDVWTTITSLEWGRPVVASTEPLTFPDGGTVWLQGDGDLGKRMETTLRAALRGNVGAFVLGADLPGLPAEILSQAHAVLADCDAVLGPCDDGGFYLLGLKYCREGLLSGIRWSESDTFLRTFTKLSRANLRVAVIQRWFDVDTPQDLVRLRTLIETRKVTAPFTRTALERLRMIHT